MLLTCNYSNSLHDASKTNCAKHTVKHVSECLKGLFSAAIKAIKVALPILGSILLFQLHPYLFCAGVATGVFFTKEVSKRADRLLGIWNSGPKVQIPLVLGGFLSLPMTVSLLALYAGVQTGRGMIRYAGLPD